MNTKTKQILTNAVNYARAHTVPVILVVVALFFGVYLAVMLGFALLGDGRDKVQDKVTDLKTDRLDRQDDKLAANQNAAVTNANTARAARESEDTRRETILAPRLRRAENANVRSKTDYDRKETEYRETIKNLNFNVPADDAALLQRNCTDLAAEFPGVKFKFCQSADSSGNANANRAPAPR